MAWNVSLACEIVHSFFAYVNASQIKLVLLQRAHWAQLPNWNFVRRACALNFNKLQRQSAPFMKLFLLDVLRRIKIKRQCHMKLLFDAFIIALKSITNYKSDFLTHSAAMSLKLGRFSRHIFYTKATRFNWHFIFENCHLLLHRCLLQTRHLDLCVSGT